MTATDFIPNWTDEFDGAITVCDTEGIIIYMNQKSIAQFSKYGGKTLVGKNLLDCHPEPSKTRLREMLEKPQKNMYTTSENGIEKMVLQTPWTEQGKFCGIVEISFILPDELPRVEK
ncbi:MAG: PAS domain-containing protein [Bacteroidota bacterium]